MGAKKCHRCCLSTIVGARTTNQVVKKDKQAPECARNPGAVTDQGNLSVRLRSGRSRLEIGRICDKLKIGRICWVCDKVTNALVRLPTASRLICRLSLVSPPTTTPRGGKIYFWGGCTRALLHSLFHLSAVFIPRLSYQKPGLG